MKKIQDVFYLSINGQIKFDISRVSDIMIVIKVLDQGIFITVISVYAPEYGLDDDQKYNFYDSLINVVTKFGEKDFNGQV